MSPLHVVYCLTSIGGGDIYEAMTRVSLATLRLTNPAVRVTIACDEQTYQALQATGSQLIHEADVVLGFPTPDGLPTFRNRFVKTQLGCLIGGPFLFLDSDTVVRKPLTSLLDLHCDIAAAPNHSRDALAEQIWSEDQANLDALGWQVRAPYVNGGVIWYGSTSGSRRFANAWHSNWLADVGLTGRFRDQPALNHTLQDLGVDVSILEHRWNAQVVSNPSVAESGIIWHIYSSTGQSSRQRFYFCCQRVRADRPLSAQSKSLRRLVEARSPEIRLGSLMWWQRLGDAVGRWLSPDSGFFQPR